MRLQPNNFEIVFVVFAIVVFVIRAIVIDVFVVVMVFIVDAVVFCRGQKKFLPQYLLITLVKPANILPRQSWSSTWYKNRSIL